jgi:hypothetical protein
VTGLFGELWTKHANMITHPPMANVNYYQNVFKIFNIPGSDFDFRMIVSPYNETFIPANQKLVAISFNRTTKVFGENVNPVTLLNPTYGIMHIAVNPIYNILMIVPAQQYTQNVQLYPLEKLTGIVGAGTATGLVWDESGHTPPVWSNDGTFIYQIANSHNNRSTNHRLYVLDPVAMTMTMRDKNTLTDYDMMYDNASRVQYLPNGDLLVFTNYTVYHGRIDATGNVLLYGYYNFTSLFGYNNGPLGFWVVGDKLMGVRSNREATSIPAISFQKLQNIESNHLVFNAPPASGVAITSTFHVDYIPKDTDYILDLEVSYSFMGG